MIYKENQKIIILLVILAIINYFQNKKERFETEQKGIIRYTSSNAECDLTLSNDRLSLECSIDESRNETGNDTNTFIITPENILKNINSQYIYVSNDFKYILDSNINEIINREGISYYPLKKIPTGPNKSALSFNNKKITLNSNNISTSGTNSGYKFI
jgi:hypothetical protein